MDTHHNTLTFHNFPELPKELRLIIWTLCLPAPRILAISPGLPGWEASMTSPRTQQPTLLFVNQESRHFALEKYMLLQFVDFDIAFDPRTDYVFLTNTMMPLSAPQHWNHFKDFIKSPPNSITNQDEGCSTPGRIRRILIKEVDLVLGLSVFISNHNHLSRFLTLDEIVVLPLGSRFNSYQIGDYIHPLDQPVLEIRTEPSSSDLSFTEPIGNHSEPPVKEFEAPKNLARTFASLLVQSRDRANPTKTVPTIRVLHYGLWDTMDPYCIPLRSRPKSLLDTFCTIL